MAQGTHSCSALGMSPVRGAGAAGGWDIVRAFAVGAGAGLCAWPAWESVAEAGWDWPMAAGAVWTASSVRGRQTASRRSRRVFGPADMGSPRCERVFLEAQTAAPAAGRADACSSCAHSAWASRLRGWTGCGCCREGTVGQGPFVGGIAPPRMSQCGDEQVRTMALRIPGQAGAGLAQTGPVP